MTFKIINKIVFVIILPAIMFFGSCEKLVTVDPPTNQLISGTVFNNDQSALSAIAGLYSSISKNGTGFGNSGVTVICGASADEIYNAATTTYDEITQNNISIASPLMNTNLWVPAYNYIYQANSILEGISSSKSEISAALSSQLKGEALFVRSFCYFYLVNLFGDIPLVTGTNYQKNAGIARTSADEVYAQIISDLKSAIDLLNSSYPNNNKGRPNRYTAAALLARVYLYQKDWKDAEAMATTVISSDQYALVSNLDSIFLTNSREAIWQLIPVPNTANTSEAGVFIPGANAVPNFAITSFLLSAFDSEDLRKTHWLAEKTVGGSSYFYPFKYKVKTATGVAVTEYYMMLRLAEQYLIRAEAKAEQNKLSDAIGDLDKIRSRAGLPLISDTKPSIQQQDLLDTIYHERQTELFCEWGSRWLDLKRTGRADAILGSEKPSWHSSAALFPIPQAQRTTNPTLTQNPGYNN